MRRWRRGLIQQIRCQHAWLKDEYIDLRAWEIADLRAFLTNMHSIDLANWQGALSEARQPFNLGRLIRLVKEYHQLKPVIVDCTSSEAVDNQYTYFLADVFHVVTPNKKANTASNGLLPSNARHRCDFAS